uniref:Uncharacterized protein n=1 Tax=Schlesneria paludicola TaxID=360056 RepID=A0A7C4QKC1_9PLAN
MRIPALAALLPKALPSKGLLVEWLEEGWGSGVETVAAACHLPLAAGRVWAVVEERDEFFPAPFGELCQNHPLLVVRSREVRERYWAVEECLRCSGVGLTWCRIDRPPPVVLRRWKLAVERGGGIGVLFRPKLHQKEPTWADVRWLVTPVPGTPEGRRWQVALLYSRGGFVTGVITLERHHATGVVRVVSPVGHSTVSTGGTCATAAACRAVG